MQEQLEYFRLTHEIQNLKIDDQTPVSSEFTFQSTNFGQESQQGQPNNSDEHNQASINLNHQPHVEVLVTNGFFHQEVSRVPTSEIEVESEAVMEVALKQDEQPKEYSSFVTQAGVQNINQSTLLEAVSEEENGQNHNGNENSQQDKKIKKLRKNPKRLSQRNNQSTSVHLRAKSKKTFKRMSQVQTATRQQGSKDLGPNKKIFYVPLKPTRRSKKISKKLFISKLSLSIKKISEESSQKQKTLLSQEIKNYLYEEAKFRAYEADPDKDFLQALTTNPGQIFSFLPKRLKELEGRADQERLKEIKNFIFNQANIEG